MVSLEQKEDNKILNFEFDWKIISLIILLIVLAGVMTGFHLKDTTVQDNFETIKTETNRINYFKQKITDSQAKIDSARAVLEENGIKMITGSGTNE